MAQGNYREYLRGDVVWLKKYFYVLRPLLAIRWIEEEETAVPMEFEILVDRFVTDTHLRRAIEQLLKAKRDGKELDRGPMIPEISNFIEAELARLEKDMPNRVASKTDIKKLNEIFHFALETAW
jgi:predicted nucleotidyltransferase